MFYERLNVCTIFNQLAKGLKFDAVIINNANEDIYSSKNLLDMNLLYVAITRSEDFYDLYVLINIHKNDINNKNLIKIIENVFNKKNIKFDISNFKKIVEILEYSNALTVYLLVIKKLKYLNKYDSKIQLM